MFRIEKSCKDSPSALIIFDGFGYRSDEKGNAIAHANMTTWKWLWSNYPHVLLQASGRAVGLPGGFMGNSEVGHLCMGAGRVVPTALCKFHDCIDDGSFFKMAWLIKKFEALKKNNRSLHILGLISDAGVHSHEKHVYAVLKLAQQLKIPAFVHAFLDGRDVPPKSAAGYLERLQKHGAIASIHGRLYAMDRDHNWERTKKSYDVLMGAHVQAKTWQEVLHDSYAQGVTDEFVEPTLLMPEGKIEPGDGVFFVNFRPDRARQLTEAFLNPGGRLEFFISPALYDDTFKNDVLFTEQKITHTLLDEIADQTLAPVFIIAETEKYAHVTYFFRGKVDIQLPQETRVLIPSIKVRTYIDHPQMSAPQITEKIVESLKNPAYFYLVNYANADMVGHSGNFEATVEACRCLDQQLKILYEEIVEKRGGTIFLTGDHGNAEEKLLPNGEPKTSHTCNPVPFMIINKSYKGQEKEFQKEYGVADIAPTILQFLGLCVPKAMNRGILTVDSED